MADGFLKTRVPWLAVAAATVLAFLPVLGNGFVDWDDDANLVGNAFYRGFSLEHLQWMGTTFLLGHWQPLTWFSFAVDHALWGMDPRGYHLTSLLLHVVNGLLVMRLAQALVPRVSSWAAALAGLLFAVHPLRVESVAWVTERRDVLSTCFLLLALLAWLRWVRQGETSRGGYLLSLVLLALSLMSKAWGMTFPLLLLVLDVWPLKRWGRGAARLLLEKTPHFGLAAGAALLAGLAQRGTGAMEGVAAHGMIERIVQAAYGLGFYLWKTLLPSGLTPLVPLEPIVAWARPVHVAALVFVVSLSVLSWILRRRLPALAAVWVTYVIVLLPVLGLVQTGPQKVADRYSYLASIPWAVLAAAALGTLVQRRPTWRQGVVGVSTLIVVALSALTWVQSGHWRDSTSLWERGVAVDPDNAMALRNRGQVHQRAGDLASARADYERALALRPDLADLHVSLGSVAQEEGELAESLEHLDRALSRSPGDADGWLLRGLSLQRLGSLAEAEAAYRRALDARPTFARAYNNLGLLRVEQGRLDEAVTAFGAAIERDPLLAPAFSNRALASLRAGSFPEAIRDTTRALELDLSLVDARFNRALAREASGDLAGALADYDAYLTVEPCAVDAYFNRGILRLSDGDVVAAREDFDAAVRCAPENPAAWLNRGALELQAGNLEQARLDCEAALGLAPRLPLAQACLEQIAQRQGAGP